MKINPNTAHRVVQELVADGTLEVMPGKGTRIAAPRTLTTVQRRRMIGPDLEKLVIEAKRLGFGLNELTTDISHQWKTMGGDKK